MHKVQFFCLSLPRFGVGAVERRNGDEVTGFCSASEKLFFWVGREVEWKKVRYGVDIKGRLDVIEERNRFRWRAKERNWM